jgi:threonine aldolase
MAQARVISISQTTELGTVYATEEIAALAQFAHAHDLLLHVDGARLFNAQRPLPPGVDAVSLGATKAGGLGAEAAVFLNGPVPHAKWVRKQLGQLGSKHRFLSAQFVALLSEGLAERCAQHANAMASRLAEAVEGAVPLTRRPQANAVFAVLPPEVTARLQERWPFYVWDEHTGEVRWMTAWDTTPEEVDAFAAAIRAATSA